MAEEPNDPNVEAEADEDGASAPVPEKVRPWFVLLRFYVIFRGSLVLYLAVRSVVLRDVFLLETLRFRFRCAYIYLLLLTVIIIIIIIR